MKFLASALLISLSFCLSAQIQLLNDEFDDASSLSDWLNINDTEQWNAEHLEIIDIDNSTNGRLHMMPYTGVWYQDYRSNFIYKNVDQDFVFTTQVSATNRTQNGIPVGDFSLAGVMIRTPRNYPNGAYGAGGWTSGGENYIFLSVGNANASAGPEFEVKSTTNGNSSLQITPIPTNIDVQIRIARIDEAILVLYRFPDGDWEVHQRYNRNDFPDELQVGFVAYTDWNKSNNYSPIFHNSNVLNDDLANDPDGSGAPFAPGLIGTFDFARFNDVQLPSNLIGVNLVNNATDNEILSFLDYESVPNSTCLSAFNNTNGISINVKTILQGPFNNSNNLMNDNLRVNNVLPLNNPYFINDNFDHNGSEETCESVLNIEGDNAIVDWILVELRSANNPTQITGSRAGLLQRDGDIVDTDGVSLLKFPVNPGQYYISIRHRNHLGIMTNSAIAVNDGTSIDFTNNSNQIYGQNGLVILANSARAMWAGNANSNSAIIFQGDNNDPNAIFFNILLASGNNQNQTNYSNNGYFAEDLNMDGQVIYQGGNNDPNSCFFNILFHPSNNTNSTNFTIFEQLP